MRKVSGTLQVYPVLGDKHEVVVVHYAQGATATWVPAAGTMGVLPISVHPIGTVGDEVTLRLPGRKRRRRRG